MVLPLINALALFGSGYLLAQSEDKDAPKSSDYIPPYEPPFQGGQCIASYLLFAEKEGGGYGYCFPFQGALREVVFSEDNTRITAFYNGGSNTRTVIQVHGGGKFSGKIGLKLNNDNLSFPDPTAPPDNCGNLPNPNPNPSPSNTSGLASEGFDSNAEPNTELAAPLVPFLPSFLAALNAALAAAAAAANALDGIKAVADAIAAIADLLKKIREDLNEKEKEKDKNKEVLSYRFGNIEKDGFLRLYPSDSFADCEAFQLDILIKSIPIGYGKYFGRFSPNYFEYKRLGHIAFVSGSFGVIERKFIEFGRSSFSIPKGSVGFYYHLGLDGIIKADASAIYLREVEQVE